jgi:hypothetical protein
MTTQEIANRLVELVRAGDYETAHKELYNADEIVSIENPVYQDDMMKYMEVKGMDAKDAKSEKWNEDIVEMFEEGAGEPIVVDNAFAVKIFFDAETKSMGKRAKMEELAVYSVKDGKIVREEFIY